MLLVHNFTPHQHKGSFTKSSQFLTQQEPDALLQKIILGFYTNLGQGHLDNFEAKDHGHDLLTLDFLLFVPFVVAAFEFCVSLLFGHKNTRYTKQEANFYNSAYLNIPSLRGPPVLA